MKRYLTNLWRATIGANPFREEVDKVKKDYEESVEKLTALQNVYCDLIEKWEYCDGQLKSAGKKIATLSKKVRDYERLIENLRERLAEKSSLIERIEADYQERIKNMRNVM